MQGKNETGKFAKILLSGPFPKTLFLIHFDYGQEKFYSYQYRYIGRILLT